MAHLLGLLLLAALYAATVLYLYDLLVAGPEWARVLLTMALTYLFLVLWDENWSTERVLHSIPAAGGALLLVALLQLLQVKRDAAMTSVLRRGR